MKIEVSRMPPQQKYHEGSVFIDSDGDANFVVLDDTAGLIVVCLAKRTMFVRGRVETAELDHWERLAPGDRVTFTVE